MAEVISSPRTLLSANLSESTLRKIAWFLNVPAGVSVDDYFNLCPTRDEGDVITTFSKYTRVFAGEDPEAPPDDDEDERRFRQLSSAGSGTAQASSLNEPSTSSKRSADAAGATSSNANQGASTSNRVTAKKRKTGAGGAYGMSANSASGSSVQYPVVEEGRKVAAKVEDQWTMMTVLKYNKRTRAYVLLDADDQADTKEEHEIPKDLVIPLASPEYTPPVFAVGTRVLGVYPGTTVFYPAVVNKTVRRSVASNKQTGKPIYDYYLQFDDDDADSNGDIIPKKIKCDFVVEEV